ncbi:family 78 glycoside hydrolase catalytic domain [Asticcacaulis machinosus]|uniref:alpha-L-rhamnosidase n=1 Tax=Asticcacaulis machinosus TaxID=2984211 RepID=A0ABT5HHA9_9CAUL|nr:family 78 glycoside hydrolase catalytic domain [Asticcacaulis machinosus]MDC7675582.1 family 78 glycoside hydrolase catalytic domain [Asticcacaulis machinosus]
MRPVTRRDMAGIMALTAASTWPASGAARASTPEIDDVRIEWQVNPAGIDTLRPRFNWRLGRAEAPARGILQRAFRLRVDDGTSVIFDSGRVKSAKLRFQPTRPLMLKSQNRYGYTLDIWDNSGRHARDTGHFLTGLMSSSDRRAVWISNGPDVIPSPAIERRTETIRQGAVMPLFRSSFVVQSSPVLAHLCVAGLGQYQLSLNGKPVGAVGLNGHWTDYTKTILYDAYDVTGLVLAGSNDIDVALGNGFFNVESVEGRYAKLSGRFGAPQLWLQMRLVYPDGREVYVTSNGQWMTANSGTFLSSIYAGEDYDARTVPAFVPAVEIKGTGGALKASSFAPLSVRERLKPKVTVARVGDVLVFDFGLNHSGRPVITLTDTQPGQVVRILPSELLLENGTIDQQSQIGGQKRGYKGIGFTYICRGGGLETWAPQFTYTGYRYLQVEGSLRAQISIESDFISAALDDTGTFSSSDSNLEAIHSLIRQALVSNTASVLTDCPHREKLGWLEQIYLNAATTMMNLDTVRLYEKMALDMRDAQLPTGMVPSIVPEYVKFIDKKGKDTPFRDSPEWGAAIIMAPWFVYQLYGDLDILSSTYEAMQAHAQYMHTRRGGDGLIEFGLGDWFDVGPATPGVAQLTSLKMTGTATYILELDTLAKIANCLGRSAAPYADLASQARADLRRALYDPATGRFDTGSQTAQAMAIVLNLVPPDEVARVMSRLIDDIRTHQNHLTAGDIGFHYVVRALSDRGRSDVLYQMLTQPDKPSYLEQIQKGATALTEAWDGAPHASQNHFMLGHAEIWFWQGLGGINLDFSADAPLVIAPQPVDKVASTRVTYRSVVGTIKSGLSVQGRRTRLSATVPEGVEALIKVPTVKPLYEGSRRLTKGNGITDIALVNGQSHVRVGSGTYEFEYDTDV